MEESKEFVSSSPFMPPQPCLLLFIDMSQAGLDAHLQELTAEGEWCQKEAYLRITFFFFLEMKMFVLTL